MKPELVIYIPFIVIYIPSLYPSTVTESASRVSQCNESRCDICKN